MRVVSLLLVLVLALGGVACTESRAPAGPLPVACPQTTEDVQRILLAPSCGSASCHAGATAAAGLDTHGVDCTDTDCDSDPVCTGT